MDLELIFLGTAGALPTVDRGTSGILVVRGGDRLLIDCGEGTQRQLMRSAGLSRIDRVFLTHLHGDHYLGLPGLLKTLNLQGRTDPFHIYGPTGLERLFSEAQRVFGRHDYPLILSEVEPGDRVAFDGYVMATAATDHGIPGLAWSLEEEVRPGRFHPEVAISLGVEEGPDFRRLQMGQTVRSRTGIEVTPAEVMDAPRPGRKIVVSGDTRPTMAVVALARGAGVLVHDSTFADSEQERAEATHHSTAREAAQVAKMAGVSLLVLTHVSSRHGPRELLQEAREVFPSSYLPRDLDRLVVPLPDKGQPRFVPAARARGSCHPSEPL
ncbi:MAG: ribonuclease Z [Actinobacteria bacterium]|nr:ribonuclease Z [Actinomycetota bacterium]